MGRMILDILGKTAACVFSAVCIVPLAAFPEVASGDGGAASSVRRPDGGDGKDCAFYVGVGRGVRLESAFRLSDGTLLVGGGADSLEWLPQDVRVSSIGGVRPVGGATGKTPFILHLSSDGRSILEVCAFPADCAEDIAAIKTTSVPGAPTGEMFVAGRVKADASNGLKADGYFIGRLDGNFVTARPEKLLWSKSVHAGGGMRSGRLPWDVSAEGRVIYAYGEPYGYDWMAVEALEPDGAAAVVPGWRRHWIRVADGGMKEFAGTADQAPEKIDHSGIVLKSVGRGDFRSWNEGDWRRQVPDGNGGHNQGAWPFDAMFAGPFDNATGETVKINENGRGWYGYRWGRNPTACVGGIVIDRRDGAIYIGGNNQSRLPSRQPDFEPWVVAMDKTGALKWWKRLYPESKGVSTPDQYVDGLAIDYSVPCAPGDGCLVVLARCHGNNVNNLWNGDKIQRASRPGFQPRFTGTHGNAHYGWLGRMTESDGTMLSATYVAEYGEGSKHGGKTFSEPLLDHWPHTLSGWPNLNTTKIHSLAVDGCGRIYIVATGRRVITTKNAYQQMPSPLADPGMKGVWSDFARVYRQDLSTLDYSSLLVGAWDWETGEGASGVKLVDILPVPGGLLVVGNAPPSKDGVVRGNDMPTRNVPVWGAASHDREAGVIAIFHFSP